MGYCGQFCTISEALGLQTLTTQPGGIAAFWDPLAGIPPLCRDSPSVQGFPLCAPIIMSERDQLHQMLNTLLPPLCRDSPSVQGCPLCAPIIMSERDQLHQTLNTLLPPLCRDSLSVQGFPLCAGIPPLCRDSPSVPQ